MQTVRVWLERLRKVALKVDEFGQAVYAPQPSNSEPTPAAPAPTPSAPALPVVRLATGETWNNDDGEDGEQGFTSPPIRWVGANATVSPDAWPAGGRQISKDFWLYEFACSGSHPALVRPVPAALESRVDQLVTRGLQKVRNRIARAIRVLSCYRNNALNRAVGGSSTSQHVVAEAVDWTCARLRDAFEDVVRMVKAGELAGIGQIIYYPDRRFVHMATASGRFSRPTLHVHWPARGYDYRVFPASLESLESLVPRAIDPSV